MADLTPAGATEQVERALERLVAVMRSRAREFAHEIHPDLAPFGFRILVTLLNRGAMRVKELGDELAIDKRYLSRQIARLEQLGLVRRSRDEADNRMTWIEVTHDTARRLRGSAELQREQLRQSLAGWSPVQLADLAAMLDDLTS
jgi:DNA-binding MarR family transcriptional regulator